MQQYLRERKARETNSRIVGIVLTLLFHAGAVACVSFAGLSYMDPPPQEMSFMVDFEEEDETTAPEEHGVEKDLAPLSVPDPHGDVEVPSPEPESEPKIDSRALFPGMARVDTASVAQKPAPDGNDGVISDTPNAQLKGRPHKGNLARPVYKVQESGTVVVTIWVDLYGNVKKTEIDFDGTTVQNKALWQAAVNAAKETHFAIGNEKTEPLQKGRIIYNFNLK